MASIHIDDKVKDLITASYPQAQDAGDDPHKLSTIAYPHVEYSQPEKAEIEQWLITSSHVATATEDPAKTAERLSSLNTHLSTRSTLLGSKPSIADVGMYARLAPIVKLWTPEERTGEQGYHHIVRHLDFVQNSPMFSLKIAEGEKIPVELDSIVAPVKTFDAKAEKEKKKKEKAAAAAGGEAAPAQKADKPVKEKAKDAGEKAKETGEKIADAVAAKVPGVKKEKKEKQPKPPKAAAVEKPLSPALIDLRVGHILKCERHPNADSLFVSTINCGDAPGTDNTSEYEGKIVRTVCSGLNGLIPLEDMQDRRVVTVCNLKPVTMRGIKSCAMVLAASPRLAPGVEDNHAGPVELVNPPVAAEAGDRVYFEGWEGEPEPVLNPKKKVWDMCQVGFTTTEAKEIAFDVAAVEQLKESGKTGLATLKTKSGVCTVPTLINGIVR